jgi:uncharacterized protein
MEERSEKIRKLYDAFDESAAQFKKEAACGQGCAYCCKDAGTIDITTLEGFIIKRKLDIMPRSRQIALKKALIADMKKRQVGKSSVCPFLMKNDRCMIYEIRPFSCRRIYSVHRCDATHPPMLNRNFMDIANQTIKSLQQLDDTGYSGHISYILHMLNIPRFLSTYLSGEFKPEECIDFAKSHRIVINQK